MNLLLITQAIRVPSQLTHAASNAVALMFTTITILLPFGFTRINISHAEQISAFDDSPAALLDELHTPGSISSNVKTKIMQHGNSGKAEMSGHEK